MGERHGSHCLQPCSPLSNASRKRNSLLMLSANHRKVVASGHSNRLCAIATMRPIQAAQLEKSRAYVRSVRLWPGLGHSSRSLVRFGTAVSAKTRLPDHTQISVNGRRRCR